MRWPSIRKKNQDKQHEPYKLASTYAYASSHTDDKSVDAQIQNLARLGKLGYHLDGDFSDRETSVFYNPVKKDVIVAYRGTDLADKTTRMKDLWSDAHILTGTQKYDKRFKQALSDYGSIKNKYAKEGYNVNVTGHSLGGAIARHVNKHNQGSVKEGVYFSRGSTPFNAFPNPLNNWNPINPVKWLTHSGKRNLPNETDISNRYDPISLGARLEMGNQVVDTTLRDPLSAHNLATL